MSKKFNLRDAYRDARAKRAFKRYKKKHTPDEAKAIIVEKEKIIIPVLTDLLKDVGISGKTAFTAIVLHSMRVDGIIEDSEIEACAPVLQTVFGDDFDADKVKADLLAEPSEEMQTALREVTVRIGDLPEQVKSEIRYIVWIICNVDGKLSDEEMQWLRDLYGTVIEEPEKKKKKKKSA